MSLKGKGVGLIANTDMNNLPCRGGKINIYSKYMYQEFFLYTANYTANQL